MVAQPTATFVCLSSVSAGQDSMKSQVNNLECSANCLHKVNVHANPIETLNRKLVAALRLQFLNLCSNGVVGSFEHKLSLLCSAVIHCSSCGGGVWDVKLEDSEAKNGQTLRIEYAATKAATLIVTRCKPLSKATASTDRYRDRSQRTSIPRLFPAQHARPWSDLAHFNFPHLVWCGGCCL